MKAIKDSAIYLIGEFTSKLAPFLLLPYLSRKLGVDGYGELSYYQTYLALFLIIIGLSQEGAVARYFYFYGKRSLNLIVNTGYAYSSFIGAIILAICYWLGSEILVYVAISAIFQSFINVQLSVRQCQKKAVQYSMIQLLLAVFSTVITFLTLEFYQTELVEKRILAILFSNILVFIIVYLFYRSSTSKKHFHFYQYKLAISYLTAFGIPLIFHQISLFLKGQLDRILIFHRFSEAELGLYAMGVQIASILTVAILAVNKAMVPYLFEGLKKQTINLAKLKKYTVYSLLLVPIPALITMCVPESLFTWLLGTAFLGVKYYVTLFLISTMLLIPYLLLVNYLFYFGKNKYISFCSVLSTVIYVVSLLLFSLWKIEVIPFASIIGAVVILPILFLITSKVEKTV